MASRARTSGKCRRRRSIRKLVYQKAMIISLLQVIHALLFISALSPCRLLSSTTRRQPLSKAWLPNQPLTSGRILDDSYWYKRTLLQGINYDDIDLNYNKTSRTLDIGANRNSIPAHEQLLSSTKTSSQSSVDSSPSPLQTTATANVSPLKVMVFIDGTWLYYSIYERRFDQDVISQKLGKYWKSESTPDWSRLPTVACQALLQDPKSKWSAIMPLDTDDSNNPDSKISSTRPIEVARVSVYSSMHRDTPKDSFRYKMFAEMIKAGFDVNMMETVGKGEKCVDIQLAVDMLYYATVPDAYDVALLLTGDRDFLPAIIRCRQKGRRIGLVSMRTGSLAFEVTPNLKDYDTIFMEDYLSQWIRKKTPEELSRSTSFERQKPSLRTARGKSSRISPYTLNKVVTNFLVKSGQPQVSSRDIGRHLKRLSVSGIPLLDEIKAVYGGLYQFLIVSKIYNVMADSRRTHKAFWVALHGDKENLVEYAQGGSLSENEKKFLTTYEQWVPVDMNKEYDFTMNEPDISPLQQIDIVKPIANQGNLDQEGDSSPVDYNALTIPELKEICREKGLKVSAKKKSELVQRIEDHVNSENLQSKSTIIESSPEEYLKSLVLEYLHASGGQASSRDVGRYLAANKTSRRALYKSTGPPTSALAELKEIYGSLVTFVKNIPDFYVRALEGREFSICIDQKSMSKPRSR